MMKGSNVRDQNPTTATVASAPVRKKKRDKRKKAIPAKGDPDYLSPTQLRNRRKRRANKQQKNSSTSNDRDVDKNTRSHDTPTKSQIISEDPSMKYISYPKSAPIVQAAKAFFKSIDSKNVTNSIKFHIHLGSLYNWRTVSKLAVRADDTSKNNKPQVAIGLFLPSSHTLLPVPNNQAHHPSINQVVECVTKACHEIGIEPYQETSMTNNSGQNYSIDESGNGEGKLRYIGVNIERKTGGAQLTLVWNGEAPRNNKINDPCLSKLIAKILSMSNCTTEENNDNSLNVQTEVENPISNTQVLNLDEQPAKKKRRRGNREKASTFQEETKQSCGTESSSKRSLSITISNQASFHKNNNNKVNLHSMWINYNLSWKHSNAIFAYDSSCWKHVHGPNSIVEHLIFGSDNKNTVYANPSPITYPVPLHFPPNVFRQANLDAFTNIVARIRERVMALGKELENSILPTCIELYGGVGTIGLHLSDIVSSLVSSDENPNNAKCFNDSIGRFPRDVQSRLLYKQKNATDMVLTEERLFLNCQVLVVDPPRKGLDADVVEFLCETGWQTLKLVVYVSCGFRAFQRDCNAMLNSGHWKLEFAEGYLLFPGSDAIETLAFFTSELTVSGSR